MIKINLLPARKAKRVVEPGGQQIYIGVLCLGILGGLVYVTVHRPLKQKYVNLAGVVEGNRQDVDNKAKQVKDYETLKKVVAAAEERSASIDRLMKMKAVPANFLHELGEILTPGRMPTMSTEMTKRVGDGPSGDSNRRFQIDWDPTHVWVTDFEEKEGAFTLKGGAQTDSEMTQFAKRLQASVYFDEVTPQGGERVSDTAASLSYYKFTLTGKVVY
jgi:Tfp pilus assembly protein PilN